MYIISRKLRSGIRNHSFRPAPFQKNDKWKSPDAESGKRIDATDLLPEAGSSLFIRRW